MQEREEKEREREVRERDKREARDEREMTDRDNREKQENAANKTVSLSHTSKIMIISPIHFLDNIIKNMKYLLSQVLNRNF